jgi:hypothetical protein
VFWHQKKGSGNACSLPEKVISKRLTLWLPPYGSRADWRWAQGTPIERRERLREYRWSRYGGFAGLEKMKWFLDSEPLQGVFESYTGRRRKAMQYRRWVEEGLIGEIEDPFEAVKWQQVLGGEGFLRKLKDHWNQRP